MAELMKTIIRIISAGIALCAGVAATAQTNVSDVAAEIAGIWQAGETYMPQPPKEMWQDIKEITFHTNGIAEWSEVKRDKLVTMTGRYMMQPDDVSKRQLPTLFVAPTNYLNPMMSSVCLLRLSELTIELDSRFHIERYGKALKAVTPDGRRLVFIKKKEAANQVPEDTARKLADPQH